MEKAIPAWGDIIVRTGKDMYSGPAKLGKIIQVKSCDRNNSTIWYGNGVQIRSPHWRYATPKEKDAFKHGVLNISDIISTVDNYSII